MLCVCIVVSQKLCFGTEDFKVKHRKRTPLVSTFSSTLILFICQGATYLQQGQNTERNWLCDLGAGPDNNCYVYSGAQQQCLSPWATLLPHFWEMWSRFSSAKLFHWWSHCAKVTTSFCMRECFWVCICMGESRRKSFPWIINK